nr:cobalt transporter [Pelotalea chapellei]
MLCGIVLSVALLTGRSDAVEKWQGLDEAVVQKIAAEQGRNAREPLVSLEGDLQLFAFLLAGAVGGFMAGYYWRVLLEGKKQSSK